jgi:DNA-directed RNA polymerase subunit alpha
VRKVNFTIEEVRVGREINYDKLVMDVWTNGSIKPDDAVHESAKILGSHISLFQNIGQKSEDLGITVEKGAAGEETTLDMSVDDLELSARSSNCLHKAGIKTIRELLTYSEMDLMKVKNFGAKSAREVKEKLIELSLSLREA